MFDPDQYNDNNEQGTPKEEKVKKPKTFNRLDERFQVQPHHDPEHIFPEEYEMINELKKEFPLSGLPDKALCVFLCARRHNLDAVKVLLANYLAKRAELFGKRYPTSDDAWRVLNRGQFLYAPHIVDKHGRMVLYYRMAMDDPTATTLEDKLRLQFWEEEFKLRNVPLSVMRNGVISVVDLKGFSIQNLDLQHGREVNNALTDLVPKRMRALVTINGGMIFNFAIQSAKYILSKKIMKRVHTMELENLTDLIPKEFLLEEYGGECKWSLEDFHQMILKADETMLPVYQNPKLRMTKSNKTMALMGMKAMKSMPVLQEHTTLEEVQLPSTKQTEEENEGVVTSRSRSASIAAAAPRLQMTKSLKMINKSQLNFSLQSLPTNQQ